MVGMIRVQKKVGMNDRDDGRCEAAEIRTRLSVYAGFLDCSDDDIREIQIFSSQFWHLRRWNSHCKRTDEADSVC